MYGVTVRAPTPRTWWLPQCPPPAGASQGYAGSPRWLAYLWHNLVLTVMPTVVACGCLGGQQLDQPPTCDLGVPGTERDTPASLSGDVQLG